MLAISYFLHHFIGRTKKLEERSCFLCLQNLLGSLVISVYFPLEARAHYCSSSVEKEGKRRNQHVEWSSGKFPLLRCFYLRIISSLQVVSLLLGFLLKLLDFFCSSLKTHSVLCASDLQQNVKLLYPLFIQYDLAALCPSCDILLFPMS